MRVGWSWVLVAGAAFALTPRATSAGHAGVPPVVTVRSDYIQRLIELREQVLFVDLREPSAFQMGHVPGAISLPIGELERRYGELPRAGRVILYCDCPAEQSAAAYGLLRDKGYVNHAVLEDGYRGWVRQLAR